ncbi:MAG: T9SS type A sorting domain-containing protein [Saprospiraceae bacterium]|nr:T9SS type A sorting domain-containing protein [Saprospiraceae bacterium]
MVFIIILFLVSVTSSLTGQTGRFDDQFAGQGTFLLDQNGNSERIITLTNQSDGSILAGGYSEDSLGRHYLMFRLDESGNIDLAFGNMGFLKDTFRIDQTSVNDLIIDGQERIIAGIDRYNDQNGFMQITRLWPDGTTDTTFGQLGNAMLPDSAKNWHVQDLELDAEKRIYVTGFVNQKGFILRLDAQGNIDTTFADLGVFLLTEIGSSFIYFQNIELDEDGTVVGAGIYYGDSAVFNIFALRLSESGELDTTFANQGYFLYDQGVHSLECNALRVYDHTILMGGSVYTTINNPLLIRLGANGEPDKQFGDEGVAIYSTKNNDVVYSFEIQSDQKIIAGGDQALFRILPDGTLDSIFGVNGFIETDRMYIVATLMDDRDRLVTGGSLFVPDHALDMIINRYLINQTSTVLSENGLVLDAVIYPNPVNDQSFLKIISQSPEKVELRLYSMTGVECFEMSYFLQTGENRIPLTLAGSLPAGIYTLKIREKTQSRFLPVMKM